MTVQGETTTQGIVLSDAAAVKVGSLLEQEGREDLRLRIAVQPGGCSGLRYQLYFDERDMDGDVVSEFGAVQVVTDKMSVPYLSGATIDFVDTIEKQGFTIDNPNASGLVRLRRLVPLDLEITGQTRRYRAGTARQDSRRTGHRSAAFCCQRASVREPGDHRQRLR